MDAGSTVTATELSEEFASRSGFESVLFVDTSLADTGQVLDQRGIEFTVGVFARLGEFITHQSSPVVLIGSEIANHTCTVTAICGSVTDLMIVTESGIAMAPQQSLNHIAAALKTLDAGNLIERAGALKLEMAAALNNLRFQSLVESLEIEVGLLAYLRLVESAPVTEFIEECLLRGFSLRVDKDNLVTIEPPLTSSRADLFELGKAINESLVTVGSHSSAPPVKSVVAASRLTPHERDLLANVPPHHGD